MQLCSICIEDLQSPVALPCGHVFCNECILRAVNAIKPYSTLHSCPTCRSLYTVSHVNPALIPTHLRPHIAPSIRRLYLDQPTRPRDELTPAAEAVVENRRLNAENLALRTNCEMWRKRAEVHGAATLGLLNLARIAREHAVQMKVERDDLERLCNSLKRKAPDEEYTSSQPHHVLIPSPPTSAYPVNNLCGLYSTCSTKPVAPLPSFITLNSVPLHSGTSIAGTSSSRPIKRMRVSPTLGD